MKTKFLLFAAATMLSTAMYAQSKTTFGIRAGVNFQNLNGRDAADNKLENKLKTGFNAGVNAEIPVATDFYVQPGLLFTTKGAKADVGDFKTNLSYVELPINLLYKPVLGTSKLLLGFGPYLGYAIGGKVKNDNSSVDINFGDKVGEIKRFDAGANFLAGYEFTTNLSFQLNAGLGLVNINNRANTDKKSRVRNTGFGLSLGYRF
jgi:Outer membrane protein beta-barrel domain